eukprot:1186112-Prorocentrum_minimum.AAC.1
MFGILHCIRCIRKGLWGVERILAVSGTGGPLPLPSSPTKHSSSPGQLSQQSCNRQRLQVSGFVPAVSAVKRLIGSP